ncbi:MAG: M48 family metalloprotease [Armatimonadota bacterium]
MVSKRLLFFVITIVITGLVAQVAEAVSLAEEIDLGNKIDLQIMKDNALYSDEQAQKEIDEYGQALAKFVKRTDIEYHFKVLEDDSFNAFSVPGGYVYFTSRLWNVLRKDERIGVLGHEIVHVDNRHAIDAISKQQKRQTILAVLLAATRASRIMGDIASIAEQLYSLKYSRKDEEEADFGAVDFCQKAGYNPAGILLSMYKIRRFEDESGGAPPKIFSDHPPTKERLDYLVKLLTDKGIPVPPENVGTVEMAGKVGEVTANKPESITFTSDQPLKNGDVVWVMRNGWDSHYEKHTSVPIGRGIVDSTGSSYTAKMTMITMPKAWPLANGMGVFVPESPKLEKGVGSLMPVSSTSPVAKLQLDSKPGQFERLVAVQAVWNKENTKLIADSVGYLVVTDPANPSGYIALQRPKYSYAPMESGANLVKVNDPDAGRWVGPILSIGTSRATIEVPGTVVLDPSKTYDVLYPAWNSKDKYKDRIVGTAKPEPKSGAKVVLRMSSFSGGWNVSQLRNGFDVYERKTENAEEVDTKGKGE